METKSRLLEMCKGGEHPTCEGLMEIPGARPRGPDNPKGVLRYACSCECHQKTCTCDSCGAQSMVMPGLQCPSCGKGTMKAA